MSSSYPAHYTEFVVPAHSLAGLQEGMSHATCAVDAAMAQHFYSAQTFDRVTRDPHGERT
jgi:hypothetical protein